MTAEDLYYVVRCTCVNICLRGIDKWDYLGDW